MSSTMAVQPRRPVNTNWSIDTTAKSIITLGTGVLTAALSDNVQPLAVLACERYGATLAMCPEVCMKVERLAKRTYAFNVLGRINLKIGFAPGDVADQLASNEAGVRFLALAPALLSLGSAFKAALCLHKLLDETSPEKQLLPTVNQLTDLLQVLETKLSSSGFLDNLTIWDTILRSDEMGLYDLFPCPNLEPPEAQRSDLTGSFGDSGLTQDQPSEPGSIAESSLRAPVAGESAGSAVSADRGLNVNVISTLRSVPHPLGSGDEGHSVATTNSADLVQAAMLNQNRDSQIQEGDVRGVMASSITENPVNQPREDPVTSEILIQMLSFGHLSLSEQFSGMWNTVRQHEKASPRPKRILLGPHPDPEQWLSGCPSVAQISKLLHAMSEMSRLGEVSFTIVQTPPLTAAWTITFIRWCLGVEPYIRRQHGQQLILKQAESHVTVEISDYGTKTFTVKTFKTFSGIHQLLWESSSFLVKPSAWNGMVKIKTYFNIKLRQLQTSYRLFQLQDTFLFLASVFQHQFCPNVGGNLPSGSLSFSPWVNSSSELVSLITMYFDVEDAISLIEKQNQDELSKIWAKYPTTATRQAIQLFIEIVLSSLIENAHHSSDPEVFFELNSFTGHSAAPNTLVDSVLKFLLQGPSAVECEILFTHVIEGGVLKLLGDGHVLADRTSTLASSSKGQVSYLSLLETLSAHQQSMCRRIVLPGWLQYKGERYSHIIGDYRMHQLDLDLTKVNPCDFSDVSFEVTHTQEDFSWMITIQDKYLEIYLAPYLTSNASIDIRSSIKGIQNLLFVEGCTSTCAQLSDFAPGLIYCRNIAAALSDLKDSTFRVLECGKNRIDRFYAQTLVANQIIRGQHPGTRFLFGVSCQNICIACAYQRVANEFSTILGRLKNSRIIFII